MQIHILLESEEVMSRCHELASSFKRAKIVGDADHDDTQLEANMWWHVIDQLILKTWLVSQHQSGFCGITSLLYLLLE